MRISVTPVGSAATAASPVRVAGFVACALFAAATAVYAIAVTQWSGRQVASLDVQSGTLLLLPGLTVSHTGPRAHQVGPVHLEPAMNPARLLAHISYQPPRVGQSIACRVTMRDAQGRSLWSESHRVGSHRSGKTSRTSTNTTVVLRTFDVAEAGDYVFDVELDSGIYELVHNAKLEVRRQVASVNPLLVALGILASIAGLVVGFAAVGTAAPSATPLRRAA